MSREIVAWVTPQPESARASSNSNCVPTRLRETTLSIRRCRSAFASCIGREYVCIVSKQRSLVEHPSDAAQAPLVRPLRLHRRNRHDRVASHLGAHLAYAHGRGASDEEMTNADQKVERTAN